MGIIAWIVLGAIAGWLASIIVGNNKDQGMLGNIAVGILGAMLGGFIFDAIGGEGVTGFNLYSIIVAVVGAIILLMIVRALRKK